MHTIKVHIIKIQLRACRFSFFLIYLRETWWKLHLHIIEDSRSRPIYVVKMQNKMRFAYYNQNIYTQRKQAADGWLFWGKRWGFNNWSPFGRGLARSMITKSTSSRKSIYTHKNITHNPNAFGSPRICSLRAIIFEMLPYRLYARRKYIATICMYIQSQKQTESHATGHKIYKYM